MKNAKRFLALLLCLMLCVSLLPAAYAAEEATEVPDAAESDAPETRPAPDETADTGETDPDPDPTPADEAEDPTAPAEPAELTGELEEDTAAKEAQNGVVVSGECGAQGDNLTWTLDDNGTLTISGEGEMQDYDYDQNSPYYAPWWSDYNHQITNVVINSGVTSIGTYAFYAIRLTSVTIPPSVTSIGDGAFYECTRLTSVTIPSSVTSIGDAAFIGCGSLASVTISSGVTSIGVMAFDYCYSLTSVTIPSSVTSIGYMAFAECEKLETICFEGAPPTIDPYAFWQTNATVYYPDGQGWSSSDRQQYGGTLNWVPFGSPRIVTQPSDVTTSEGTTARFAIEATDAALSYQWYYKAPNGSAFKKCTVASGRTASYSLTAAAKYNGYQFYCVVTDDFIGDSVQSDTVTLTVVSGPTITAQPQNVTVDEGNRAYFSVAATGTDLAYQWWYKAPTATRFYKSSSEAGHTANYSLSGLASKNGQQVYCVITDAYGSSVRSDTATLTVVSGPKITAQPYDVTVPEGSVASFKVTATGKNLSYQWWYKTPKADSFVMSTTASGRKAEYSLNGAAKYDGYQFYCVVTDGSGNTVRSNTVTLTVETGPTIKTQPSSLTVAEGATAGFSVVAAGEDLAYQWYYKAPAADKFSRASVASAKTANYKLTAAAKFNGYQFFCIVTDGEGKSVQSDTVTLTVRPKAQILGQPGNVTAPAARNVTFAVVAQGENLSYQWQLSRDGGQSWNACQESGSDGNLLIVPAGSYDGCLFRCEIVSNGGAVYTEPASLTVG